MANPERSASSQERMTTKLRIKMPRIQSQTEDLEMRDEDPKSDSDSQPSPPLPSAKMPRPSAKRKASKNVTFSSESSPISPAVTASPATTPPPEPSAKRKGGNKRKFTHEYCLTCQRYGRACGGRRDGEDGCAVCRDPDRSKGEKLRECLWADPENGIHDYKTARDVFKKAQAELRSQRSKPQGVKRQRSDAAVSRPTASDYASRAPDSSIPTGPLPQTSRPLDLLPPATSKSGYVSHQARQRQFDEDDLAQADDSDIAADMSITNTSHDQQPRIHKPQLSYITVGPNGEILPRGPYANLPPPPPPNGQVVGSGPVFWDHRINSWASPFTHAIPTRQAPRQYAHAYRSAYDAPPSPPPRLSRLNNQEPASPPSLILDKYGTPPRKWSSEGFKITSIDGTEWRSKSWKREDDKEGDAQHAAGETERGRILDDGISDTSTLSTCLSIDEDMVDVNMVEQSNSAIATNGAKLRLRIGNHSDNKTAQRTSTFTFPGEITIQADEEDGTSASDAELSSDDSKHKSLPAKLRKILSRSRVTKVIIDGDVFEIRPRSLVPSAKINKKSSTGGNALLNGSRKKTHGKARRPEARIPLAESEDETDYREHGDYSATRSETVEAQKRHAPIKIKLIFNRKSTIDLPEKTQQERPSDAVDVSARGPLTPGDDTEMDESWQRNP